MVTRKKQQQTRAGLLNPSRKKVDWQSPRTGDYSRAERRTSQNFAGTATAGNTTILYTCPAGKRAKLINYQHRLDANSAGNLEVANVAISSLNTQATATTGQVSFIFLGYEAGIDISSQQTVKVNCAGGSAGSSVATVIIVEEDAGSGFFIE